MPGTTSSAAREHAEGFRGLQHALQHHSLVSNVAAGPDAAAFVATARLAARWVASHLLSNHVTHEAVELLVASLFACPATLQPPGAGFLCLIEFVFYFSLPISALRLLSSCRVFLLRGILEGLPSLSSDSFPD